MHYREEAGAGRTVVGLRGLAAHQPSPNEGLPCESSAVLSLEQTQAYERDGFLVLEGFVPSTDVARLRAHIETLTRSYDPRCGFGVFGTEEQRRHTDAYFLRSAAETSYFVEPTAVGPEGELTGAFANSVNKMGHAMHDLDPVFDQFSRSPRVADLAKALGYREPKLAQSMVVFKVPRLGGSVGWHQDATFLATEPNTVTGLWFALEDTDLGNGCLWARPGSHHGPVRSVYKSDGVSRTWFEHGDGDPLEASMDGAVPLEVRAGTVIVLHGRLAHMSKANTSSRSRVAYTLHIIDGQAHYPSWNWLQRPAELPFRGFST